VSLSFVCRMTMGLTLSVAAFASLDAAVASAQDGAPPSTASTQPAAPAPPKPAPPPWWNFNTDLGFINTTGNTSVSTLNFSDALNVWTDHSNKLSEMVGITYGTLSNRVQTSLWTADLRDAYTLTPAVGFYGLFEFDRNVFAGIEQRFDEGAGVALIPVNRGRNHLELDLGATYVEQRSTTAVEDNYTAATGTIAYQYNFGKDTYFKESLEDISDLKTTADYRLDSHTDLVAPLSKHIAIKVGYEIRYSNLPPPGFKTTDRLLTTDLQFNF
jgi:putative salt-induced outer membrane protein YdiY